MDKILNNFYLPKDIITLILKFRGDAMMVDHKKKIKALQKHFEFKKKQLTNIENLIWRQDCQLTKTINRVFSRIFTPSKNGIGNKTRQYIVDLIEDEDLLIFSDYEYNHKYQKVVCL